MLFHSIFTSSEKKKTLFERGICFASRLFIKFAGLNAVLKKTILPNWDEDFLRRRFTRFIMLENFVNSFAHASCRLHVFNA